MLITSHFLAAYGIGLYSIDGNHELTTLGYAEWISAQNTGLAVT